MKLYKKGLTVISACIIFTLGCAAVKPDIKEGGGKGYKKTPGLYGTEMDKAMKDYENFPSVPLKQRPKVTFWDFKNETRRGEIILFKEPHSMMLSELVRSRQFRVVDRKTLKAVIKQHKIDKSDMFEATKKVSKIMNCDYHIDGSITVLDGGDEYASESAYRKGKRCWGHAEIDLFLYDPRSGEQLYCARGVGNYEKTITQVGGEGPSCTYGPEYDINALRLAMNDTLHDLLKQTKRR